MRPPLYLMDCYSGDVIRRATAEEIRACDESRTGEIKVDGRAVCLATMDRDTDGHVWAVSL